MEFDRSKPAEIIGRVVQTPWLIGRQVFEVAKLFTSDTEGFAHRADEADYERVRLDWQLTELESRVEARSMANIMAEEVLYRAANGLVFDEPLQSLTHMLQNPLMDVTLDTIWLRPGHADMLRPFVEDALQRQV